MLSKFKYLNRKNVLYVALILLAIVSATGFTNRNKTESPSLKITHGNLVFEVDSDLRTRFSSILISSKPAVEDFQASENVTINKKEISKFELKNVSESALSGELSGRKWIIKGVYEEDGLRLLKKLKLTAYDDFPDLISVVVEYINASNDGIFIESWIHGNYIILS